MSALNASHGGPPEDITYGLALARRLAEAHACRVNLYIPQDRPAQLAVGQARPDSRPHPDSHQYTIAKADFDFLRPYLALQPYIQEVFFVREADIPADAVRLDPYRFVQGLNLAAGNIADFAGKVYGIPIDVSEAWLSARGPCGQAGDTNPDGADTSSAEQEGRRWLVTVGFTPYHRNAAIDYSFLACVGGVRFVGSRTDYEDFRTRHALPNLIYHPCATALELADAIRSARVFIGNRSLAFAIAEGLKVNRALESCELAPNVVPSGPGGGSFVYQSGLVSLLRRWGIEVPRHASRSAPPKYVLELPALVPVAVPAPKIVPPATSIAASSACNASSSVPAATPRRIRIVCATREGREAFFSNTPLGRSLKLRRPPDVDVRLFPRNVAGLPSVYNTAIDESSEEGAILLFVHDDVHLWDFHWADRLREGLRAFDIVGLAGNRRRVPRQPGWMFLDEKLTRDRRENLSGIVGHGRDSSVTSVDEFGPCGQEVKLLDGVFLAASSETLRTNALRFDERFDFHFYDLDFCRQVERARLRMGTWPISVVHESGGNFGSESWYRGYERYLEKWQD